MVRVRDVSGADEEEEKGTETSKCDQSDFQGSFMLDSTLPIPLLKKNVPINRILLLL